MNLWLTSGPTLQVTGDFSVLITFANTNGSGFLDLIGYSSSGLYPVGFVALEVGLGGNSISLNYYDGSSSPPATTNFSLPRGVTAPVTVEVARIGSQKRNRSYHRDGHCIFSEVRVEKNALSDHAALVCRVKLPDMRTFTPPLQL